MKAHLPEYLSEFFGTATMMLIGIGAVTIMFAEGGAMQHLIPSGDVRRLLTGLVFAGGGTLVVLSPLGQCSGGHLNPAMTLAFWWKGKITTPDAVWYVAAQLAGALLGVVLVALIGGEAARSVHFGLTLPGEGFPTAVAFVAETLITFLLIFVVLYCVAHARFARYTPFLAGALVALLVFVEAPISGTSLNPARSLAPALLNPNFDRQWIYILAPILGAVLAVKLFGYFFESAKQAGCAKLFHTERYRCIFLDCTHTSVPAGTVVIREGETPDRAYVVERGELSVQVRGADGEPVTLASLHAGDWVGEMALLLGLPRSATVTAITDCKLRPVTQDSLTHVIAQHPEETARLLRLLAERLYEADQSLASRKC